MTDIFTWIGKIIVFGSGALVGVFGIAMIVAGLLLYRRTTRGDR